MTRSLFAMLLAGLVGFGLAWGLGRLMVGERSTTTRLSPDETLRALLVDRPGTDRIFEIRIEDLVHETTTTIFRSPAEGHPAGTERLIWSKDGSKLLLVGRHFFVKQDFFLDNGDQLYFFYDRSTGQTWCNADGLSSLPELQAGMVEGVEFTEPVRLKEPIQTP